VKVAALNTTGSGILTTYAFSGNKTVTVRPIDDNGGTSCNARRSLFGLRQTGGRNPDDLFASGDAGFKRSGNFTVPACQSDRANE
jgi:hypothetical protein